MKKVFRFFPALVSLALVGRAAEEFPRAWIDADTGHRIVQLSTEPGSACLYFTQYAYTVGGTKLLMTTPRGTDLVTLKTGEAQNCVAGDFYCSVHGQNQLEAPPPGRRLPHVE